MLIATNRVSTTYDQQLNLSIQFPLIISTGNSDPLGT